MSLNKITKKVKDAKTKESENTNFDVLLILPHNGRDDRDDRDKYPTDGTPSVVITQILKGEISEIVAIGKKDQDILTSPKLQIYWSDDPKITVGKSIKNPSHGD